MTTLLRLGPKDHGRPVTEEDLATAHYDQGYGYEVIDGKLYVSPLPDCSHDNLEQWLLDLWKGYVREHPEVVNYVTNKARVFVPERPGLTVPEPDLAAYPNYPFALRRPDRHWARINPAFVAEVISPDTADKDLVCNVAFYLEVPSIREYWILEERNDAVRLLVYRRRGSRWQRVIEVAEGETYTSRHFPGLELTLTVR